MTTPNYNCLGLSTFDAEKEQNVILNNFSAPSAEFLIQTLMKDIKAVVAKKNDYLYREKRTPNHV